MSATATADAPGAAAGRLTPGPTLDALEAEAIHILREVAAEFERPVHAVLRRQGLRGHAAPGRQGVLARRRCRSRCCTSTPGTTSPR